MQRIHINIDPETKITTKIFHVFDENGIPKYLLKTMELPSNMQDEADQARREFDLAKMLGANHPNIAKGIDIREFWDTGMQHFEMLFEYGGETLLALSKKGFYGSDILRIAAQTIDALCYAHEKGIFHFDLKPQKIVYDGSLAKIISFGVSPDLHGNPQLGSGIISKTAAYCPPEVLNNEIEKTALAIAAIDVFSWGKTFYHILSKKVDETLVKEAKEFQMKESKYHRFLAEVDKLKVDGVSSEVSSKFVNMVKKCLCFANLERPKFEELRNEMREILEMAKMLPLSKISDLTAVTIPILPGLLFQNKREEEKKIALLSQATEEILPVKRKESIPLALKPDSNASISTISNERTTENILSLLPSVSR